MNIYPEIFRSQITEISVLRIRLPVRVELLKSRVLVHIPLIERLDTEKIP